MILKLTAFPDFETIRLGLAFITLLLYRVADGGVYRLVMKIQLEEPFLFDDIFPTAWQRSCERKYLKVCGAGNDIIGYIK